VGGNKLFVVLIFVVLFFIVFIFSSSFFFLFLFFCFSLSVIHVDDPSISKIRLDQQRGRKKVVGDKQLMQ
jgi:hypothetical protein